MDKMDKQKLLENIKEYTLKNGVGEFDIYNNQMATSGYTCSIKHVAIIDINDFNFEIIDKIIDENKKLLSYKNVFLGTWINRYRNYIYIDITKNYKSKYYVLKVAKKLQRLAIFDLNNNTSIYLK